LNAEQDLDLMGAILTRRSGKSTFLTCIVKQRGRALRVDWRFKDEGRYAGPGDRRG